VIQDDEVRSLVVLVVVVVLVMVLVAVYIDDDYDDDDNDDNTCNIIYITMQCQDTALFCAASRQ